MLDWSENQLERLVRKWRFALISRLHPELRSLRSEQEQMWALVYADDDETPAWWRWTSAGLTWLGAPLLLFIGTCMFAEATGLGWRRHWIWMALGAWIIGALAVAATVQHIRGRRLRSRCFAAMRVFGRDVCPSCGYEMSGHEGKPWQPRTCPECGSAVPPAQAPPAERRPAA